MGKQPWPDEDVSCSPKSLYQEHVSVMVHHHPNLRGEEVDEVERNEESSGDVAHGQQVFATPWWFESYDTPRAKRESGVDAVEMTG